MSRWIMAEHLVDHDHSPFSVLGRAAGSAGQQTVSANFDILPVTPAVQLSAFRPEANYS